MMKTRARDETTTPFELSVLTRGVVDEGAIGYAKKKIAHAARAAPRRVLFGRLKLTHEPHRSVARPAIAEVMLDLDGSAVRAHVAARDLREASDLLEQRLRRKLKDIERASEFRRRFTGIAEPGGWRRGDLSTHRPDYFARPSEDREVVRRKTFTLGHLTPAEAAVEMESLDHDFHLFVDATGGGDAVVHRLPDGGYELISERPVEVGGDVPVSASATRPVTMHLQEAVRRLNDGGEPFLFYIDAATRRGTVLYHRYDGHYGVIAPAEPQGKGANPDGHRGG